MWRYFCSFFVQMKNLKFASEIYWSLGKLIFLTLPTRVFNLIHGYWMIMYVIRVCTILIALNLVDAFLENIINEAIVSLQENIYGPFWAHICTGVLVGKPKLMLTAAHCFENKMNLVDKKSLDYSPNRLKVIFNRNNNIFCCFMRNTLI